MNERLMENFEQILDLNKDVLERLKHDQVRYDAAFRRTFFRDEEFARFSESTIARRLGAQGVMKMEDGGMIVQY